MATSSMTKAKGLQTFLNYLSAVPEGSLFEAENVIIDRDGVIEPRRGIKVLGNIPDKAKQLLTYKERILAHYGDTLAFSNGADPATFTSYKKRADFNPSAVNTTSDRITINLHGLSEDDPIVFSSTTTLPAPLVAGVTYYVTNPTQNDFQLTVATDSISIIDLTTQGSGTHTATYDYVIVSPDSVARIKGVEQNGNLYLTSSNGIKKVSALNQYAIQDSGGIKALDVSLSIDFTTSSGFLDANNEVAYRITWIYTDTNSNLIQGTSSYRSVITNPSYDSRNIKISSPVPSGITTDYSYRIYRTQQSPNAGGSGDEQKLVYEAQVTAAEITAGVIQIVDEQPEELRDTGVALYSNEFSGEGILQTNDKPPTAKDIAIYKNILFFANTTTNYKLTFDLLGQDGLVHLLPGSITTTTFSAGETTFTYTAPGHGLTANQDIVLQGTTVLGKDGVFAATILNATQLKLTGDFSTINKTKTSTFTSYITITKGAISNKYYFVGRPEKYTVTVTANGAGIAGQYFLINSADDKIPYYVWLNDTGAGSPTSDPLLSNKVGIKVDYIGTGVSDSTTEIALKISDALNNTGDFDSSNSTNVISITNQNSGFATDPSSTYGTFTVAVLQDGFGQDVTKNFVRLSSFVSPAARIEDTAKSLSYIINQNSNDVVFAYYISNVSELPGSLLLEAKAIDTTPFTLKANNSETGAMFNSNLTTLQTAQNESFPNRLYFSKISQPEAVPSTNNIDIGPKDKAILRILGLRDSLFILKEEGVYRLIGDSSSNFTVSLFDNSANLLAPDTAAILNNQIYALTSQGVATISETGVGIISRPIENIFSKVTSPDYTDYASASFAFGYEADRAYLLFTIDKSTDTFATKAYRYNTFTQCWTSWKKSANCGIVETSMNRMYLGASDISAVEVERKKLTSRDYVDREYNRSLTLYNFGFVLDTVVDVEIGDSIEQTQYLTPSDYNRLIKKAKKDPYLLMDVNFPEITTTGSNLRLAMESLANELNARDTSLYSGVFNGNSDVDLITNTITITGHGLKNDDVVKLSGGTLPTPLLADVFYAVVNVAPNTIQLSATLGGTPIDLTVAGSGTVTIDESYVFSTVEDFSQHQSDFNYNVLKLNTSTGVFFTDYKASSGTIAINTLVSDVNKASSKITTANIPLLFQGPIVHYKSIKSTVIWAPIALGEPSLMKHIRMGTFLLESNVLAGATVAYASDLSGNFEDIPIGIDQDGNWGEGIWSGFAWGGDGTSVPIRVTIPRQKQRCRYIKARYKHNNAFNKFAILGISYTFEVNSDRAYK